MNPVGFAIFIPRKKKDAVKKARESDSFYGVFALQILCSYIIAKCKIVVKLPFVLTVSNGGGNIEETN